MKLLFLALLAFAETCPKGNLKECQKILDAAHLKDQGKQFTETYDAICGENKKFSCVKVVVRGDLQDEMKEQKKERGPKASLYPVTLEEEQYIFVLTNK